MKSGTVPRLSLLVILMALLCAAPAGAEEPSLTAQAALGTAFTYQGRLTDSGMPANGTYDFEFRLYDGSDPATATQVGSTVTLGDVSVSNGLFTVSLDFGAGVFDGTALWLQANVRPGADTGTYQALTPLTAVNAAPYALHAASVSWSGLTGVPGGFADGVDNDTTYTAGAGLVLNGTQFSVHYANVVVVAKSGGDFSTIQAAVDSITGASASNHYLVWVAPGTYVEQVTMKPYVDIEGAGRWLTTITYTGSSSEDTGTVIGADNTELRSLTVENTGGGGSGYATAIHGDNVSMRVTNSLVTASGANANIGIHCINSAGIILSDVAINASGGTVSAGINNAGGSSFILTNASIIAGGASTANAGVVNNASSSLINNSTILAGGGTASYGVWNRAASGGPYPVVVQHSGVGGGTSSIYNDTEFNVRVGASQLTGGAVVDPGVTAKCVWAYDENYNPFPGPGCP